MSYTELLLDETKNYLAKYGKTIENVKRVIVQVEEYSDRYVEITPTRFVELANIYYDSGLGCRNIMPTWLYGDDFVMYREEYDGAEGWEYAPMIATCTEELKTLSINEYDRTKQDELEAQMMREELE